MTTLRALVALLLCLTAVGCGDDNPFPEGSTMARIRDRGVLLVGTKFDQPMFGYKEPSSGRIIGFDTEMARMVAKDLTGSERNIRFIETVSRERENFLTQEFVDLVIATYSITEPRSRLVGFTIPYYYAGQDILVRSDDDSINGVADLKDKTVCTAKGSTSIDRIGKQVPSAELVTVDAYSICIPALMTGQVDALSTDDTILLGLLDQHPDTLRLVGRPFAREPYGMGVRKQDTAFRDYLNGLITRSLRDGEWDRAFKATIGVTGVAPDRSRPALPEQDPAAR
ncbi:glutamate ABC transporter substrate-binding protein [Nonomuraea jiangxiensis]|uniref:Glutamate transport system substrate-binding protein n=1 Tax=Nonomuraea jiangxiensis TaxID=633440 RepID=A0A1G7ZK00_9ACTN|nr:glutamate ABC transporter substrate-binding protein [Nonomuraea jiangxiensis]SDH09043.1 glutamate transport system substrate-binding protein [Nonomuraea jiangxiensis]